MDPIAMMSGRRRILLFVLLLTAISVVVIAVRSTRRSHDWPIRAGSFERRLLRVVGRALVIYDRENGMLPYSNAGSSAALYQLRRYIEYESLPDGAESVLVFDDTQQVLTDNPFEYLNQPNVSLKRLPPRLVILAYRSTDNSPGVWYLRADGFVGYEHLSDSRPAPADRLVRRQLGVDLTTEGDTETGP